MINNTNTNIYESVVYSCLLTYHRFLSWNPAGFPIVTGDIFCYKGLCPLIQTTFCFHSCKVKKTFPILLNSRNFTWIGRGFVFCAIGARPGVHMSSFYFHILNPIRLARLSALKMSSHISITASGTPLLLICSPNLLYLFFNKRSESLTLSLRDSTPFCCFLILLLNFRDNYGSMVIKK